MCTEILSKTSSRKESNIFFEINTRPLYFLKESLKKNNKIKSDNERFA